MYRIKLASGQERVYQSIDELTGAVQSGEVNGEALIYHQRADRWLSIANHPHYQIATSRAQAQKQPPASDASRRQVVNAVRPQASGGVAEMDQQHEAPRPAVKRVSIPNIKKPEEKPIITAYENVVEGVKVVPPKQTTMLPQRAAPPVSAAPARPAAPKVPDLGEEFDLVDAEFDDPPAKPQARHDAPTPQVDKLLALLEPADLVKPAKPAESKPAPVGAIPGYKDIEFLDLSADHVKEIGALTHVDSQHPTPAHTPIHQPHVARKSGMKAMLFAVAAVLVIGVGLVVWQPWSAQAANEPTQTLAAAPAPRTDAFGGSSSVDTAAPAPSTGQPARDSARRAPGDSTPAIVRVSAPRMNIKAPTGLTALSMDAPAASQIAPAILIQHYTTAYADARGEMELRMLQIGFTQIFLKNRLSSASGIQDTRRLIAGATSALRQYRSQEQRIERAYQDTVGTNGRNLGWTPRDLGTWNTRQSSKESPETARLTNLMLSQIDAVFALLQDQDGKFTLSGETITFESSDAARQYATLRAWINQQADNYAGTGDAALPATLRQVIKGIGSTRLPQDRTR